MFKIRNYRESGSCVKKSAIILQIIKQSDANAVAVSEELVKTIAKLEGEYKTALKLEI
jgi:HAE1 family hydrophobic/amphiphilic exporter-1